MLRFFIAFEMGSSESILVTSQEKSLYENRECLKRFSSDLYTDVLRLYEVLSSAVNLSGFNGNNGHDVFLYVVILMNPNKTNQCFCLFYSVHQEEAEGKFQDFCDVCVPFIDIFPSIFSTEMLSSFLKLKHTNPTWSLHKIAEHMQLPEINDWKNHHHPHEALELIKREQPSFFRDMFGSTPLQYLTERHPEFVEHCMSAVYFLQQTGKDLKASLGNFTKYSETPIHVAIRLSQDGVLRMLLEKGANPAIPCAHAFPIHLALQNETLSCAKLLREYDSNCLTYKDTKYNGSPLHWAKSSEFIDFLYEQGADLNARNFDNETPLHIMVKRKRLSPVISLLCYGANASAQSDDGSTPLHYSVKQDDIDIVKALLILGADPTIKNKDGKTALQCADDDSDIYSDLVDIFSLFDYDTSQVKSCGHQRSQSLLKEKTGQESLLSLDGGGIRGLILTEILMALESASGHSIYELFDWMCGTSTGSYLSISTALGRSARYCQHVYFRLGRIAFQGQRPYHTENMDKFLLEEFSEDAKMDAIKFPNIMIPAVMADRRPAMLHLFRNYEAPYDEHYQMRDARFPRPPLPSDQLIWLATRSSCSAPSYFRSTGRYLDGGLIANNPTLDAISEIHKYERYHDKLRENKTNLKVVVSIGTGRIPLQVLRTIDIYRPSSVWDTPEVVDNLKGFVDLMIDQVSASDDHVVDRARSWCEMIDVRYFRYNPTLPTPVELNETDDRILLNMLLDVRKYINRNFQSIISLSKILLGEVPASSQ